MHSHIVADNLIFQCFGKLFQHGKGRLRGIEALNQVNAHMYDSFQLGSGLDTFRKSQESIIVGKGYDVVDKMLFLWILFNAGNQETINLDTVGQITKQA